MKDKKCSTCVFWEEIEAAVPMLSQTSGSKQRQGFCHRYPPQAHLIMQGNRGQAQSMFPGTTNDGWCGEHTKAE